jgi:hypothetical protein
MKGIAGKQPAILTNGGDLGNRITLDSPRNRVIKTTMLCDSVPAPICPRECDLERLLKATAGYKFLIRFFRRLITRTGKLKKSNGNAGRRYLKIGKAINAIAQKYNVIKTAKI